MICAIYENQISPQRIDRIRGKEKPKLKIVSLDHYDVGHVSD